MFVCMCLTNYLHKNQDSQNGEKKKDETNQGILK